MSELHNVPSSIRSIPSSTHDTDDTEPSFSEKSTYVPPLNATQDARQLVRLVQCSQCSRPLTDPKSLPCGNSLCQNCLPSTHDLNDIDPRTNCHFQGFICPFSDCKQEHALRDCGYDVVLSKVMDLIKDKIEGFQKSDQAAKLEVEAKELDRFAAAGLSRTGAEKILKLRGGRLLATYTMVAMGDLPYDSEVTYLSISKTASQEAFEEAMDRRPWLGGNSSPSTIKTPEMLGAEFDEKILDDLREATRSELDCQVCYALFLDPYTTCCGHTFCRRCLHRVLDHSRICPVCRRSLNIPPTYLSEGGGAPLNKRLRSLLMALCPDHVESRRAAARIEDHPHAYGDLDTALFPCTIAFPTMPTFLHIFEPRYRLMMRRCLASADRNFGMLRHNAGHLPQGELGSCPFFQVGTMLRIVNNEQWNDGRSIVETAGVGRFRVTKYAMRDGYFVGKVEEFDDISPTEEAAREAAELQAARAARTRQPASNMGVNEGESFGSQSLSSSPDTDPNQPMSSSHTPPSSELSFTADDNVAEIDPQNIDLSTLSTLDLSAVPTSVMLAICHAYVEDMKAASKPWLHIRVRRAYGECPTDPALFTWWFAALLPIDDRDKYAALCLTSVRERMKLCVRWVVAMKKA